AVVRRGRAEFRPLEGAPVERPITPIPWDPVAAAKGGFKHFLAKEIHEQPETLASAIRPRIRLDPPDVHLEDFQLPVPAERIARVMLVASGTAGYAGLIGRRYMEEIAGIPAEAEIASEFAYRPLPIAPDTLVVAISQSGETADVLLAMAAAKAHGAAVVGVVNAVGSEATRRADAVVYTHAGPEISVASTKAFSSQVACLYLLACYLGRARGVLSDGRLAQLLGDLAQVPALAVAVLRCEGQMEAIARHFHRARDFLFIGRGIEYPLALEGALKLKELSYIHAEGYAAGELKHGPISLVDEEVPVVALATRSRVREKTLNAVEQVRARDGQVILIATEGDERAATLARHLVTLPATSELIAPMLAILPLQLLAYRMAVWLGCDVDQPRNLAKSVTVE
ncbi:MAG: glutamine--fructose-6-phosphate transaminase (isomerizing), partial [Actinobacteria bacterium]|nr:glutamine--fructose-6-phosphate transaminase (isomerizing) [Actinomycetota bacterium]